MILAWIVGFLIGNCISSVFQIPFIGMMIYFDIPILVVTVCLMILRWRVLLPAIVLLGVFFGGINNAPAPSGDTHVRVLKSLAISEDQKERMIFVDKKGSLWRGFGLGCEGLIGKLKAKNDKNIYESKRSYFNPEQSRKFVSIYCSSSAKNVFEIWSTYLRKDFLSRINGFSVDEKAFLKSIVIGETKELSKDIKDSFKKLGIFHLLVVSGFHVIMAVHVFNLIFKFPFQLIYSVRLIKPRSWTILSIVVDVLSSIIAVCYGYITGFSSPAQRAVIIYITARLSKIFFGQIPFYDRAIFSFFVQALLFPIGFLSESTLMSWVAYLCLIETSCGKMKDEIKKSIIQKIKQSFLSAIKQQTKLTIFAAACFAQLSVIGIIANLLFVPLFTIIFLLTFTFPFINNSDWALGRFRYVLNEYISIIRWLSLFCDDMPGLFINLDQTHSFWQCLFLIISCFVFLNILKKIKESFILIK